MVIGPGILQFVRQHLDGLKRLTLLPSCDKKGDDTRNTSDEISEVLHGFPTPGQSVWPLRGTAHKLDAASGIRVDFRLGKRGGTNGANN